MVLLSLALLARAQDDMLSGYVYDATTGSPLPGCTLFIQTLSKGTATDASGFFQLPIPRGHYQVVFSFVGYKGDTVTINVQASQSLSVRLEPETTTLSEVVVAEKVADEAVTQTETGLVSLQRKDIEKLPYLLGEVDPIRILQLMPGVQTSAEGSTGFYVRGGAVDQNLMLLDHSTVYNPSHLFGFFSIFNGTAVQGLDMYKSGIPSYYGGRLSSITKVSTRSGSDQQLKGEGSIGLVAANILVEGPLKKNKGSLLVAARRTYVDLFARGLREIGLLKRNIDYYFYDLNINFDYRLSQRERISVRTYYGADDFNYTKSRSFSNAIIWKNKTASVAWQHSGERLFTELSIQASGYDMGFGANIGSYTFDIVSDISDVGITYQFGMRKNGHDLGWGLTYTRHALRPNNVSASSDDVSLNAGSPLKLKADEAAVYLNDKIILSERAELSAGVRLSGYSQLGSFTRYIEDDNFQILDTITYGRHERIRTTER